MKKTITYLITTQVLILASVASLLFSSCIIVHPDDEIIVEKKEYEKPAVIIDNIIKIANVHTDSYRKVGWTYFTTPFSSTSIFNGKFVSYPYASTFM